MEVLQRLGAQAPAERGHEGSRACLWRCRAFKAPHPAHAALEPLGYQVLLYATAVA